MKKNQGPKVERLLEVELALANIFVGLYFPLQKIIILSFPMDSLSILPWSNPLQMSFFQALLHLAKKYIVFYIQQAKNRCHKMGQWGVDIVVKLKKLNDMLSIFCKCKKELLPGNPGYYDFFKETAS